MGSVGSKLRLSISVNNGSGPTPPKTPAKPRESANSSARADATSEDQSRIGQSTSQEQPSEGKVDQSFGWLVETPVDLQTTTNEFRDKMKIPRAARKRKSTGRNAMAYSNGRYLKSAQLASTSSNTNSTQQLQAASSKPSSDKPGKYRIKPCEVSDQGNKADTCEEKKNSEDIPETSRPGANFSVGFGAMREEKPMIMKKACQAQHHASSCQEGEDEAVDTDRE